MARQFNLIPPICEQAEYHMFQREKVEVQLPELFHKIGTGPRTPSVPQPTVQEHMSCSLAAVPHAWICCWDEKVIFWGEAGEKTIASLSRGSFAQGLHPLLLPLHPLPCAPATSALAYLILAPQAGFPAAPPVLQAGPCTQVLPNPRLKAACKVARSLSALLAPGVGAMTWSPLACGIVSGKYDGGIPPYSRASLKVSTVGRYVVQGSRGSLEPPAHCSPIPGVPVAEGQDPE